jgi:hypothetical protein
MPNSIPENQNTDQSLDRLAAQRVLYSRAKMLAGIQALLSVPAAIVWTIIANLYPEMKQWAALWGLVVAVLDLAVLDEFQSFSKQDAAKIQEAFDCTVLDLPWNSLVAGTRPEPEKIASASQKYRPDPKHPLENWYPAEVATLPLSAARFVCQRTNLWWDSTLRKRYAILLAVCASLVAIASFATALARHYSLEDSLLIFWVPLSPAYLWTIREFRKHWGTAQLSDRLKDCLETVWSQLLKRSLSEAELKDESRKLQDEIYRRRKDSPLVFDWIYNRLHPTHEAHAKKGAAEFVDEAQKFN